MDVKFISVRKSNINTVPVVDGQVIAVADANACYYDMNSRRHLISALHVMENGLSGIGESSDLYVIPDGEGKGIYAWDDADESYHLIANENTDRFLKFALGRDEKKIYPVGTNGVEDSDLLYYSDDIYFDYKNHTLHCQTVEGKSRDAYHADDSSHSDESGHSALSDEASRIGHSTVGSEIIPVWVNDGIPSVCSHSVETDVPPGALFTDTTYDAFTGATDESDGTAGLVPKPGIGDRDNFLKGDGTWSKVIQSTMIGCTSDTDGEVGLVPAPVAGKYNSFLKGDGTWASYSAGYGLELVSLTFNLADSGVEPGVYGPPGDADDDNFYEASTIPVPRITVDKYGRITSIMNVECTASIPSDLLPTFHIDERGHLIATYNVP